MTNRGGKLDAMGIADRFKLLLQMLDGDALKQTSDFLRSFGKSHSENRN
jgi:hypothetical protein